MIADLLPYTIAGAIYLLPLILNLIQSALCQINHLMLRSF